MDVDHAPIMAKSVPFPTALAYRELVPLVLAAGSMLDQTPSSMIDAAADAGFDGVGLRLSAPRGDAQYVADTTKVRTHALDRGVVIHDVEVHRIGTDTDPTPLLERAAAIGALALLVVSDATDRSRTIEGVGELVAIARSYGVRIGLEYMAWTDPATPSEAVSIASDTGCEIVVDLLHHVRIGGGTGELDEIVRSGSLGWVQICDGAARSPEDGDLVREARHGRLLPGHGALPLRELLAAVPSGTTVSVEVQSDVLQRTPPAERARLLHDAARSVVQGPTT